MLNRRVAAMASAVAAAVAFGAADATSAGASAVARQVVPWADQTVYALSPTDSYVAEWMGPSTGWIEIGGPAGHIYAGSAGVFETDSSGNIWVYNGTPFSWTQIGGPGEEFAEGGGHLYGLGPTGGYVAEWNGTPNSWTIIGGPAGSISAGTDGLVATAPYGTTEDGWYYDGTPNSWTDISGPEAEFAIGADTIYRLDENRDTISEWTGGSDWTPILSVGINDLLDLIGGDDGVYVSYETSDAGPEQYLEYDGTPNAWSVIGGGAGLVPVPIVESRTGLYGVTSASDFGPIASVDLYSGSGTTWTVIGGPADPSLAAGD
jgi:hypothetical protein